jgi:hypothetical protein
MFSRAAITVAACANLVVERTCIMALLVEARQARDGKKLTVDFVLLSSEDRGKVVGHLDGKVKL